MAENLFNSDGHITDRGFYALMNDDGLEELPRLELAEHLDFCDRCVERYSDFLLSDLLTPPAEETAPAVMEELRRQARRAGFFRITRVAAAACLTLVIWIGWIFQGDMTAANQTFVKNASENGQSFQQTVSSVSQGISDLVGGFSIYARPAKK